MGEPDLGAAVAGYYSSSAAEYERLWAEGLKPCAQRLLERLPLDDARLVVDVGAGTGSLFSFLQRRAPRAAIVGIDRSEGMIARAPRDFASSVMDAARLALAPAVFDVAVAAFMLFHLDDPGAGLSELRRVLRSGGTVGTLTWGDDPGYPAVHTWDAELDAHGAEEAIELAHHELVDTPEKMRGLLAAAGFASIEAWTGPYERALSVDEFVAIKSQLGVGKRRLDTLDERSRNACIESASARVARLERKDFIHRAEVVYATARVL
jgi:ubiquinone/menaquinone biosynthesis C-methylase UbiE